MTTPEPLDEAAATPAETRGGDQAADWEFPEYDSDDTFPYVQPELPFEDQDSP